MKTDDLIDLLGASFEREPVRSSGLTRRLAQTVGVGAAAAVCLAFLTLGLRPDLTSGQPVVFLLLKASFALTVAGLAIRFLAMAARPGGERRVNLWIVASPFLAIMVLAVGSLAFAPPTHWHAMVAGHTWLECVVAIPAIAIVPFASIMWAVRRIGAPTDLPRAGALVGLASGAVSALGYSLHCVDDTVPFVAVWYGGTIALCTVAGALLGPRLLRW